MYLSRIKLDPSRSQTMRAMVAPNLVHGALERCDDDRTRKLWRVDTLRGEPYLLILSQKQIDFSALAAQFGESSGYETRCYDGLLQRIVNGSKWHFRLKANPVIHEKNDNGKRGRILAHITPEHQAAWLRKQAEKHGFALADGEWLVSGSQWYIFKKNRNETKQVKLLAVTYEGILTVTDAEAFRAALVQGIGREKAFGLGMLTVTGCNR